ncbi:CHAP domain-containing protein [Nonomuraea candida]|uniref:CHAP domain-containing protein n=1 Tax=Nonomuraea candida TaxID=359159 RepID=UPI0006947B23|nr:CHAP domain-containing protein [Nonomuraea candida]
MTPEIQKYIELLESQLGYSEKAGAYTKFGDWYGKNVEFDADYSSAPWCDMYLSWAAHKLGYEEWIGQFAWTVAHAKWFKEQGAWGKKPQVGALVFYDWSGSNDIDRIDHVGIVTRVEGDTIYTIEGNIDGGVAKRKERDTSKVVGYGYPQRVKERLDRAAAKKKAEKQASSPGGPGGEVGTLQIPEESLSSLIPRADAGPAPRIPLAGEHLRSQDPTREATGAQGQVEGQTPGQTQGQPQPGSSDKTSGSASQRKSHSDATAQSPATSGAGSSSKSHATRGSDSATASGSHSASAPNSTSAKQGPRTAASAAPGTATKGKHAKPSTADTEEATTEPLPTLTDASATGPLSAIDSPTLVGSALVAALALLAVAKTRRLRLSPVGATAGKPAKTPRPSRAKGRRRRGRTAEVPAPPSHRRDADRRPATTERRDADRRHLDTPERRYLDTSERRNAVELQETAERLATSAALRSLAASEAARPAGARHRRLPLDTRPFDLATDTTRHHAADHHAADHRAPGAPATGHPTFDHRTADHRTPGRRTPDPAFGSRPYEPDFDRTRFTFTDETGPMERLTFTDETGPLERLTFTDETGPMERLTFTDETGPLEVVLDTGPLRRVVDTAPFERIVIPGASSAFDAFAPPMSRRGGDGGDLLGTPVPASGTGYRGRRRRHSAEERNAFSPDLPLRGRRHRRTDAEPLQQHDTALRGRRHRRGHPEDEHRLVGAGSTERGRHRA